MNISVGRDSITGNEFSIDAAKCINISGMSGMGRSTPLVNLFIEYIRQGNGALFLDPHGDAADPAAPAFAVNYPSPPYTIPIATKTASPRDAVFVCGSPKPRDKPPSVPVTPLNLIPGGNPLILNPLSAASFS
jgi:hypothetical protein